MLLKDNDYSPPSISGAGIKKEAYDSLDEEEKMWIDELADEITYTVQAFSAAEANKIISDKLDDTDDVNTWKLALYWKLDSKTRSALKKAKE